MNEIDTKKTKAKFNEIKSWFTDSSVCKESACKAGGPGSTPGSGRSAGEGISYPLQYSRASWLLVALLVKNPPAIQETWVRSLDWENPLEEGVAFSSIPAWRIPMDRRAWRAIVHGVTKSQKDWATKHTAQHKHLLWSDTAEWIWTNHFCGPGFHFFHVKWGVISRSHEFI